MKSLFSMLLIFSVSIMSLSAQKSGGPAKNTAGSIIESIIDHTGAARIPGTVDVIKEGNPQTEIKGIVTTMFATMEVMKKAVEMNCNLIIVHEPLYYSHLDETKHLVNDPVFMEKRKYIRDNNLVIWRFHDYIHSIVPDGIENGMIDKLGWRNYLVNGSNNSFIIPETTLSKLLEYLKPRFGKNSFYVVGKADMKVKSVKMAVGAPGSSLHISILEQPDTQVLLAGESPQWETYEYMRDAVDQGRNKAVIFLGHIPSEEAGMKWCEGWLRGFIKNIPATYVESGPSYWSF